MTSTILYVGLIPFDWDENIVRAVAGAVAKMIDLRLGFDFQGKNKGYVFCEYQTPEEAQKATQMLSQVRVYQSGGNYKRLRVESSKEGFLKGNTDLTMKQVMTPDPRFVPPNVKFPMEVAMNYPGLDVQQHSYPGGNNNPHASQRTRQALPQFNSPTPMTMPPQPRAGQGITPLAPQSGVVAAKFALASQNLPALPNPSPFTAPDRINETLSKIPPPQLIELVGTMKNILLGSDAARIYDVLQYPNVAPAAAQALLLMGLIDEDVIKEVTLKPQQSQPAPEPQWRNNRQHQQQHSQQHQQQQQQQQPPWGRQGNNNYTPTPPPSLLPPPPTSKWPLLPPHTQQRLSQLPGNEGDLIAQVLQLPEHEVRLLPPDKQKMVNNFRQQYL